MTEDARQAPPATLVGAAVLVGLEGLFLCVLAVLEVAALDSGAGHAGDHDGTVLRSSSAPGCSLCAWGLFRVGSWARGPVVAAELIGVLLVVQLLGR